jgi:hypothetical protein
MTTTAIKTQGTQLKIENAASPGEYTAIGQAAAITGFRSGENTEIDITNFDSTAREYIIGLKDEGTLQVSFVYDPDNAQQIRLETLRDSQASADFQLVFAAGTLKTFTFTAFVSSFSLDLEADDAVRGSVTLRITGAVTKA